MLSLISTWSAMFCSRTNDVHSVQNCILDVLVRDTSHIEAHAKARSSYLQVRKSDKIDDNIIE